VSNPTLRQILQGVWYVHAFLSGRIHFLRFFYIRVRGIYQQFMGGAFELENCFFIGGHIVYHFFDDDRNFSMLSLSKGCVR